MRPVTRCTRSGYIAKFLTERSLKMKVRTLWLVVAIAVSSLVAAAQAPSGNNGGLEAVLASMDKASASDKTIQCRFEWDQFTKVVNDIDKQEGTIYFRRAGNSVEMAAHIESPDTKIVVYSQGMVRVYQPKIDTEQRYSAGANRAEFDSFLVLGFGGRGHDLGKSFDVQYGGTETVDGVNTAQLVLVPKEDKVRQMFNKILLWIDPDRGISVQQKFFQPSGDYRLAKYSDIKINQKLPDHAFEIKTHLKTKIETPKG